jgi:hypothetical protein
VKKKVTSSPKAIRLASLAQSRLDALGQKIKSAIFSTLTRIKRIARGFTRIINVERVVDFDWTDII